MIKLSLSRARARLHELVRLAEAGEEIILTRRGKVDLKLVPINRLDSRGMSQSNRPSPERLGL